MEMRVITKGTKETNSPMIRRDCKPAVYDREYIKKGEKKNKISTWLKMIIVVINDLLFFWRQIIEFDGLISLYLLFLMIDDGCYVKEITFCKVSASSFINQEINLSLLIIHCHWDLYWWNGWRNVDHLCEVNRRERRNLSFVVEGDIRMVSFRAKILGERK